jgi:hypothetical protein
MGQDPIRENIRPDGKKIAASLRGRYELFTRRMTAFALICSARLEEDPRRFAARRKDVERALLR